MELGCDVLGRFARWMRRRRFRRNRVTRLWAASGVGCNDFGGRTGAGLRWS